MAIDLKINHKLIKKMPVLDLEGEIDVYTYPALNEAMLNLIKDGHSTMVLNLEKVTYIDSTGLGVMANSTNKVADKHGEVRVVCTQTQLIKIFTVSGLTNKNLKIFSSEAEALEPKARKK